MFLFTHRQRRRPGAAALDAMAGTLMRLPLSGADAGDRAVPNLALGRGAGERSVE